MISQDQHDQRREILDQHHQLILEIRSIEKDIEMSMSSGESWRELDDMRNKLQRQVEPLIEAYWKWIPLVKLSVCPFCQHETRIAFDPIDFHGFWWMDRTQRAGPAPEVCEHFCLLQGAVDRKGADFPDILFQGNPGPEQPYVIPRLINKEGMKVVISKINMDCGFVAYPICYFSQQPITSQQLSQSWACKEHLFVDAEGTQGWDIREEDHDTNLQPWVDQEKLIDKRMQ